MHSTVVLITYSLFFSPCCQYLLCVCTNSFSLEKLYFQTMSSYPQTSFKAFFFPEHIISFFFFHCQMSWLKVLYSFSIFHGPPIYCPQKYRFDSWCSTETIIDLFLHCLKPNLAFSLNRITLVIHCYISNITNLVA